jgi:hypothetical protein
MDLDAEDKVGKLVKQCGVNGAYLLAPHIVATMAKSVP